MNQEKIGAYIKQKRIEQGLTQEQLAANLNVSSKTVSRWERGLNNPDSSILQSLSIELGVTTSELMLGEEIKIKMNNEDYTALGLDYSQNELNQKVEKQKKYLLWTLVGTLILLIDVSYGYFSALLSWQINEKMIFPRGIIYSLLFDSAINYEGIILTNMFYIFIIVLIINISLILIYVILTLSQNKKRL